MLQHCAVSLGRAVLWHQSGALTAGFDFVCPRAGSGLLSLKGSALLGPALSDRDGQAGLSPTKVFQ